MVTRVKANEPCLRDIVDLWLRDLGPMERKAIAVFYSISGFYSREDLSGLFENFGKECQQELFDSWDHDFITGVALTAATTVT